jgi:hypothetical protein
MTARTSLFRKLTLTVAALTVAALLAAALPAAAQMHGSLRGKRMLHRATAAEATPLEVLSDLLNRLQLTDLLATLESRIATRVEALLNIFKVIF